MATTIPIRPVTTAVSRTNISTGTDAPSQRALRLTNNPGVGTIQVLPTMPVDVNRSQPPVGKVGANGQIILPPTPNTTPPPPDPYQYVLGLPIRSGTTGTGTITTNATGAANGNPGVVPPIATGTGATAAGTTATSTTANQSNQQLMQLLQQLLQGTGGASTGVGAAGTGTGTAWGNSTPATTTGTTGSQSGTNTDLVTLLQQYMDQTNAANEARYGQLLDLSNQERTERLQGLNDQYDPIFQQIGQGTQSKLDREQQVTDNQLGNQAQTAVSRGLTNTTVQDAMRRGVMDDHALRQNEIQDAATAQENAVRADYAGRLDNILGSLFANRTGFIERRADTGPDLSTILPLLTQAGAGSGTGTGTGTGSGSQSLMDLLKQLTGQGGGTGGTGTGGTGGTGNGTGVIQEPTLDQLMHGNGPAGNVGAGVGGNYTPNTNFTTGLGAPGAMIEPGLAQQLAQMLGQGGSGANRTGSNGNLLDFLGNLFKPLPTSNPGSGVASGGGTTANLDQQILNQLNGFFGSVENQGGQQQAQADDGAIPGNDGKWYIVDENGVWHQKPDQPQTAIQPADRNDGFSANQPIWYDDGSGGAWYTRDSIGKYVKQATGSGGAGVGVTYNGQRYGYNPQTGAFTNPDGTQVLRSTGLYAALFGLRKTAS